MRLLKQNRCGTQAAALSYHTIFGLVPLTLVMLIAFQIFPAYRGLGTKVKDFAYEQLNLNKIGYTVTDEGAEEDAQEERIVTIAEKIDELAEKYVTKVNTSAVTIVGLLLVIWAALGLLTTIERAFNNIWHVHRGRNFIHRMINYWALITLGPVLLGLGFYLSTRYLLGGDLQEGLRRDLQEGLPNYIQPVAPYFISLIAFFFLYFVLPNTKVSAKSALWGAAVAALLWAGAKYGFTSYVMNIIPYWSLYGILGIIPLSVFWIYITWLIVLFGLQLTYATQNLKSLDEAEIAKMRKTDEYFMTNEIAVMNIIGYVQQAFEDKNEQPVDVGQVSNTLDVPAELVEKILEHLVRTNLLCRTNEPKVGYVPATDGDSITLADIADAVAKASFAHDEEHTSEKLRSVVKSLREKLACHTLKEIVSDSHAAVDEKSDVE